MKGRLAMDNQTVGNISQLTTDGIAGTVRIVELNPNNLSELEVLTRRLTCEVAAVKNTIRQINSFKLEIGFKNKSND